MDEDNILVSRVKSGDKASLNILINKYKDVIANSASRFGSIMPVQAVNAEGMSLLIEAAERFNPSSGASFRTFLGNYLKGLNRYVNQNKNVMRLPESRTNKAGVFQATHSALRRELGRDPSDLELSEQLGVSVTDAADMRRLFTKKEVSHEGLAGGIAASGYDTRQEIILYYINGPTLPSNEKQWLEHLTGTNGKQKLTVKEVASRYNVPEHRIYEAQSRFKDAVSQRLGANAAKLLD